MQELCDHTSARVCQGLVREAGAGRGTRGRGGMDGCHTKTIMPAIVHDSSIVHDSCLSADTATCLGARVSKQVVGQGGSPHPHPPTSWAMRPTAPSSLSSLAAGGLRWTQASIATSLPLYRDPGQCR
jgi:hypothetical protein